MWNKTVNFRAIFLFNFKTKKKDWKQLKLLTIPTKGFATKWTISGLLENDLSDFTVTTWILKIVSVVDTHLSLMTVFNWPSFIKIHVEPPENYHKNFKLAIKLPATIWIRKNQKLNKWVQHDLNEEEKIRRYEICSSFLLRNHDRCISRLHCN